MVRKSLVIKPFLINPMPNNKLIYQSIPKFKQNNDILIKISINLLMMNLWYEVEVE